MFPTRVHHTTTTKITEGEPIMAGMFLVNHHPAVVLFDSRSSHSFMSFAFAHQYEQDSREMGFKYQISSTGFMS